MSDPSSSAVPPELQVILDMELTIEGLNSPVDHQKLEAALIDLSGVESVSFSEDKVSIRYHPQKVTKARLSELIVAAGFSIAAADSASPSPSVDSR